MRRSPLTVEEPLNPLKLKRDKNFQPCAAKPGDELYPNGIFEFNVTRLLAHMEAHAEGFPIEVISVGEIPDYGGDAQLDQEAIVTADLSRPILLAEISLGRYNVIDGHHRVAKARREGTQTLPARRVRCPEHVLLLTSTLAYEKYVEYWNSKLRELGHALTGAGRRKRTAVD